MALASYFDISLDLLASKRNELERGTAEAQNQEEAMLLYAYRELPPDEAKPLLQMLLSRVRLKGTDN